MVQKVYNGGMGAEAFLNHNEHLALMLSYCRMIELLAWICVLIGGRDRRCLLCVFCACLGGEEKGGGVDAGMGLELGLICW